VTVLGVSSSSTINTVGSGEKRDRCSLPVGMRGSCGCAGRLAPPHEERLLGVGRVDSDARCKPMRRRTGVAVTHVNLYHPGKLWQLYDVNLYLTLHNTI
jgi:hypothetical protein